MGSVNNKIAKPIISIGFNKNGKITFNVDLNKTNKLNKENLDSIELSLSKIKRLISGEIIVPVISNNGGEQNLHVLNDYARERNIKFHNVVTIDQLINVEVCMKNDRKFQAVKDFKIAADCGLKDAKDFVEWYADRMKVKFEYFK